MSALGEAMRRNSRRLRTLRRLSVRELESRIRPLGSRMTGSAISKLERGTRDISVQDLAYLAVGLEVPPVALLDIPDPDDTELWAPGTPETDRAWARGERRLEIGDGVDLAAGSDLRTWLVGPEVEHGPRHPAITAALDLADAIRRTLDGDRDAAVRLPHLADMASRYAAVVAADAQP